MKRYTPVLLLCASSAGGCGGEPSTSSDLDEPAQAQAFAASSRTVDEANWARWPMPNAPGTLLPNPMRYRVESDVVRDLVTNLVWERESRLTTWERAQERCKDLELDGMSDWELPTLIELVSLLHARPSGDLPHIDVEAFPDVRSSPSYWSATHLSGSELRAWTLHFDTATSGTEDAKAILPGRCVRRQPSPSGERLFELSERIVRDPRTGLEWQAEPSAPMTSAQAASHCQGITSNGVGWRLPSLNELQTLVDYGRAAPAIDVSTFSNTSADRFWTTTTQAGGRQFYVDFFTGGTGVATAGRGFARCVRLTRPT